MSLSRLVTLLLLLGIAKCDQISAGCLAISDTVAGKPIGNLSTNMDILKENITPELRFYAFYFCEDPNEQNRLTGLQLILKDPELEDSELKLNHLGPISGECRGSRLRTEGSHV